MLGGLGLPRQEDRRRRQRGSIVATRLWFWVLCGEVVCLLEWRSVQLTVVLRVVDTCCRFVLRSRSGLLLYTLMHEGRSCICTANVGC